MPMHRLGGTFAALLLLCPLPTAVLAASSTHESPSDTAGVNLAPMAVNQDWFGIGSDGDGGAIVAFGAYLGQGGSNVYAQRFGAAGAPLWGASGVTLCTEPGDQATPVVCPSGVGGGIVVWPDGRRGVRLDLYAQRIGPTGLPLWTPGGILVAGGSKSKYGLRAMSDGVGGAIVTWHDVGPSEPRGVHAQRVAANGSLLWGPDGLTLCALPNSQWDPELVPDGSGGAIVIWTDDRSGTYLLYGQHLTPGGLATWGADGRLLSPAAGRQTNVSVLEDGSGGAFLAWEDERNGPSADVYAQRIDAAGIEQWAAGGVPICTAAGSQELPRLAPVGAGGAMVVWTDHRTGSGADVYAQHVDAGGAALWGLDGMALCTAGGDQDEVRVVTDAAGGALVTWEDAREGAGEEDIYLQGVAPDGTLRWAADGLPFCTARYQQRNPDLVPGLDGRAVVAWSDDRAYWYRNVYALRTPPGPVGIGRLEAPGLSLSVPGPNPTRGSVTFEFALAQAGPVRLSLYDVAGRRVRVLIDGEFAVGVHRPRFDLDAESGPALARGLYLVRLEAAGGLSRTRRLALIR